MTYARKLAKLSSDPETLRQVANTEALIRDQKHQIELTRAGISRLCRRLDCGESTLKYLVKQRAALLR